MRVLFVTSEAYPLIKTGGLGDVSYALPNALRQQGVDIRLLLPGYSEVLQQLSLVEVYDNIRLFPLQEPIHLLAGTMANGITPVYVVKYPRLYERDGGPYQDSTGKDWPDNYLRFGILAKIAALFGDHSLLFKPQIIHCNDWQTGLVPAFLKFNDNSYARTVMSIHNMAYQGIFAPEVIEQLGLPSASFGISGLEYYGQVSFLKAGLQYADWITTVSKTYAKEIQTPVYGCGLDGLLQQRCQQLTGILNGIDIQDWNPATDHHLSHHYNINNLRTKARNTQNLRSKLGLAPMKKKPLIGMITRLIPQKGLKLLVPIIELVINSGAQFAILGSGDKDLEERLQRLAAHNPKQISVTLGYDEELAHQIEAGANIFLMPSQFEPCGLNQMYSMRYGTIPIVRRTGGLTDTVVNVNPTNLKDKTATGFVFNEGSDELLACIQLAIQTFCDKKIWHQLQVTGMKRDFSWDRSAEQYVLLYQQLLSSPS